MNKKKLEIHKQTNAEIARGTLLRKNVTIRLPERVLNALKERASRERTNIHTLLSSILQQEALD